jgi:uncharacterized protein DUF6152
MRRAYWLVALGALFTGVPAFAHHATQAEFDQNNVRTITGVMTRVLWVNPHVNWHIDVKNEDGTTTDWTIVAAGPGGFRSIGLSGRDFFKIGEVYTASIALARNGSPRGHIMTFITPDGKTLKIWSGDFNDPLGK